MPVSLPIDEVIPTLLSVLKERSNVVLHAPTGAGKTTRVPVALDSASWRMGGRILMLEPRRVAARAAARRMADEREEHVGASIGYHVRMDRKATDSTQILVVTEGIFLRMIQEDPFLEDVDAVIFDEFHERGLQTDIALAMVRKVQQELRPEIRIIAMSATLDTQRIARYLGDAPILESKGRSFPVHRVYTAQATHSNLAERVAWGVRQEAKETQGDLLAFLPGVGEIRQTRQLLESWAIKEQFELMELFGDLPPSEQDRVLLPGTHRKVILSTNVAETSLTIEGITSVVDSGYVKVIRFDPACGFNRLELEKNSRASTEQRAGRAGRMGPGRCLRLWTEGDQNRRKEHDEPEIQRVDLTATVLELLAWGESDLTHFPWFEAPEHEALARALELLYQLGAVDLDKRLTPVGHTMAQLPVHPRLARLLFAAIEWDCIDDATWLAALLSERSPFIRPELETLEHLDLIEQIDALRALFGRSNTSSIWTERSIRRGAAKWIAQTQKQWMRTLKRFSTDAIVHSTPQSSALDPTTREERLGRALLAAFPDRLVRRRSAKTGRGQMVGRRGVRLPDAEMLFPTELCLCVEVQAGQRKVFSEAIVRKMMTIEHSWLPSTTVTKGIEQAFDEDKLRVVAWERERFFDLILRERIVATPSSDETEKILVDAAASRLHQAFALDERTVAQWIARVRCLSEWMPELELPRFEYDEWMALLPMLCHGKRSFKELRSMPLLPMLQGSLSYSQLQSIDREAPERMQLPGGSRVRLNYEEGKPPILAARIQQMFGCSDTPTVAGGRIPVLLHLLAPNMRPQQITQDLRSFWKHTYPEVRKELRQRYPKHAWPEHVE